MTRRSVFGFLFAALCFSQIVSLQAQTPFEEECVKLAARIGSDSERLHELFKLTWEHRMREDPEFATEVGYPGQNDRWSDVSLQAIERRKRELQGPLKVIQSIDRSKLSAGDQLNYDLFRKSQEEAIEGTRFRDEYMPLTQ